MTINFSMWKWHFIFLLYFWKWIFVRTCCYKQRSLREKVKSAALKIVPSLWQRFFKNTKMQQIRHGPEIPKIVFMAVGFRTYGHAKSMAQWHSLCLYDEKSMTQLLTSLIGLPPTYIHSKFKKLYLSPSQQDPYWALHLKMPPHW